MDGPSPFFRSLHLSFPLSLAGDDFDGPSENWKFGPSPKSYSNSEILKFECEPREPITLNQQFSISRDHFASVERERGRGKLETRKYSASGKRKQNSFVSQNFISFSIQLSIQLSRSPLHSSASARVLRAVSLGDLFDTLSTNKLRMREGLLLRSPLALRKLLPKPPPPAVAIPFEDSNFR